MSSISGEIIEAVRAAVPIHTIAVTLTELRPVGGELLGLCPFHNEKTPSFRVNPSKGVFYCHGGCGAGGDVFRLVMLAEGLTFPEALRRLTTIGSVPLEEIAAPTTAEQCKRRAHGKKRRCEYELVHKYRRWMGRAFQTYLETRDQMRQRIAWLAEFTSWAESYSAYERSEWYFRQRQHGEDELALLCDREGILEERLRILTEGADNERMELLDHVA